MNKSFLVSPKLTIMKKDRQRLNKHKPTVIWFTGLSGAGKSTLAYKLNEVLFNRKVQSYVLDGDNIRQGLNSNLGFSPQDREENIRRIGEVAKLFVDAGFIAISAFISPYNKDRQRNRDIVEAGEFLEVYVKCPLEVCEKRDVKGMYKKAREGIIKEFTGISAPYEAPENPEIVVETDKMDADECIEIILNYLQENHYIDNGRDKDNIIMPHGGELINCIENDGEAVGNNGNGKYAHKIKLADWLVSDCEMIANGGFSPLQGFMDNKTVESVLNHMQLLDGTLWSIPIVLPVSETEAKDIKEGVEVALFDKHERLIAILKVSEKYFLDKNKFCQEVFKTTEEKHPGVRLIKNAGEVCLAGEIRLVNRPKREGIDTKYYLDPEETRKLIKEKGWKNIVAFQTRNPIHRAHEYLIKTALENVDGVLIHPLVGETKADDIPADVRMRCYEAIIEKYFNKDKVLLSVLPMAMRYAGPREAIHHMIVRKNYGCSHMIVGRDHAGVGDYYGSYEAQGLVKKYQDKLEIEPICFEHSFYCKKCESMATKKTCPHGNEEHVFLSGTKVRQMLRDGKLPPKEFSRPEVAKVLVDWTLSQGRFF
jgi:ATP sulfurylase/adenylyl-sulfate kinase